MKKPHLMSLLLCLASLCCFTVRAAEPQPPLQVAKAWYAAILRGDLSAADKLSADKETCRSNAGNVATLAELRKKAATDPESRNILNLLENATFSKEVINGDRATISVSFPDSSDPSRIMLCKVDGEWRVTILKEEEVKEEKKPEPLSDADIAAAAESARQWWQAILAEDKKTADRFVVDPDHNANLIQYVHDLKAKADTDAEAKKELEDMRKAAFGKVEPKPQAAMVIVHMFKDGQPFFRILFLKQNGKMLILTIN